MDEFGRMWLFLGLMMLTLHAGKNCFFAYCDYQAFGSVVSEQAQWGGATHVARFYSRTLCIIDEKRFDGFGEEVLVPRGIIECRKLQFPRHI